jgi:hypothetical protein
MKDLFRLTFSKVSKFGYDDYYHDFVQHAPFWLLRSAALAHEDVQAFPGFPGLYSFLQTYSFTCWRNPELYPHLTRILRARDIESDCESHLLALEGHLGLREVNAQVFTHRYFRLRGPLPQTFELVDGQIRRLPNAILMNDEDFPLVYRPVPHLFDDVVGGTATYDGSPLPIPPSKIEQIVRDAADVLRQYDIELYRGFTEAVGTLAITGEWNLGNRSSYSTGSIYTGGIFTSLCENSPIMLVESLIHEYYHQRLWLWWLIEAPADIPDRGVTMVSPISKQVRAVQIMMQALLIYVSLTDYYRWADRVFAEQSDWTGMRWRNLQSGTVELLSMLRQALAGRDESLRFVNSIAELSIN